jgi:hypothetical protein
VLDRGIKREYRNYKGGFFLWTLSRSLSPLLTNTGLTWTSEEAPPDTPRRVFPVLQVRARIKECLWWCHVTGSKTSSTFGAVCGNDVVVHTKTETQNGDWW